MNSLPGSKIWYLVTIHIDSTLLKYNFSEKISLTKHSLKRIILNLTLKTYENKYYKIKRMDTKGRTTSSSNAYYKLLKGCPSSI